MLGYLSPWECGSHAQTVDFLDRVRAGAAPTAPTAGLEMAALIDLYQGTLDQGGLEALTAVHLWSRPNAVAALDRALADWPRPGYLTHAAAVADLNLLAYALVQAKRAARRARCSVRSGAWRRRTRGPWRTAIPCSPSAAGSSARQADGRDTRTGCSRP